MATANTLLAAADLALLDRSGERRELVRGVVRVMSPAGGRHGRVAHALGLLVGSHVKLQDLGAVYAAETGFLLARDPDTVRAPDVAFVSRSRAAPLDGEGGFVAVVPEFVGEVVSPRDSFSDVEEKVLDWLAAGTRLVVVVDPATRTVHAHRAGGLVSVFREAEVLDAGDAVPGLVIPVAELFR